MSANPCRSATTAGSVLLALALAGALVTVATGQARANWFGESYYSAVCPNNGNITDDKNVQFSYIDASSDMRDAANWTRFDRLNPTQLDTSYDHNPGDSTDVILRDRYYEEWCENELGFEWTTNGVTGLRGLAACYDLTRDRGRCRQQVVRVSNHFFDAHGDAGDKWIVCHEVGHAIGLTHRSFSEGCMYNEADVSDRKYVNHDINHFEANWANEPRDIDQ